MINYSYAIFEDEILHLVNGTITSQKPALLKENGFYITPKKNIICDFKSTKDYFDSSLKKSVKTFMDLIACDKKFDDISFNMALDSQRQMIALLHEN